MPITLSNKKASVLRPVFLSRAGLNGPPGKLGGTEYPVRDPLMPERHGLPT